MSRRIIYLLPMALSGIIFILVAFLWPQSNQFQVHNISIWSAWVSITLLIILAVTLLYYGIYLFQANKQRSGSRLRAKLVMALICMLLIPGMTLQITANQLVDRALSAWFDVRVDTLLDRALNLAQGFYNRIEHDLQQKLESYSHDLRLIDIAQTPIDYVRLNVQLSHIMAYEDWQRLQLFDLNGRQLGGVKESGLKVQPVELGNDAKLALSLVQAVTHYTSFEGDDIAVAYVPLQSTSGVIGLLRAEVHLPKEVVSSAREVEGDYRNYQNLKNHRTSIQDAFMYMMLSINLAITGIAALLALFFAHRITQPINGLEKALRQVREGNLDVHIQSTPHDELGSLSRSFNSMTKRLQENMHTLKDTETELKLALNSSQQRQTILQTLLENLQTGVLLMDADGHIRLFNRSLIQVLHLNVPWEPAQHISQACIGKLEDIHHFFEELYHQEQGKLQRQMDIDVGHRMIHLLARGELLENIGEEGTSGYILLFDDISEFINMQRQRAWTEVARHLAHEIKNPLTPIKLAAERLQRRCRNQVEDTDIFDRCTSTVITQVERLQRLVLDFSTLARMPKPRLAMVDVDRLLMEMQDLYTSYPQLEVQLPTAAIHLECDIDQMRQILINLMDNALSATTTNKEQVRLYVQVECQYIHFHIEDDGEGIAEQQEDHIFEPYYSTKSDGSGLGLAIAKRIVEEHKGTLMLLSRSHPTHFCVHIPLRSEGGNHDSTHPNR
ncbi:MAG: ATP-binding protein [Mariprofundaceae bacterium]|nr:ATP-binding protein [Mariprofundaceae bacterium]